MKVEARPMTQHDVRAAVDAWRSADADLRSRLHLPRLHWDQALVGRYQRRTEHFLRTDPDGSWVADRHGEVLGLAQAYRRDGLWILAHLFVAPAAQDQGVGRCLMRRALDYASHADRCLIVSSADPRAMRRYTLAGFALHPCVIGWGTVRSSGLAATPEVRAGDESDLESLAAIDRHVRGAARIDELALCLREGDQLLVVTDRGYTLLRRDRVASLVALDDDAAAQLLTAGLAQSRADQPAEVPRILATQQWAAQVTLSAGLELHPHGPLMLRGLPAPSAPYLPDGALG